MDLQSNCNGLVKALAVEAEILLPRDVFDMRLTDYESLLHNGKTFLRKIDPDLVVCNLFCLRYDAIDVAELIDQAGIGACLRLVSPTLPRPNMILREIRAACPSVQIDYFQADENFNAVPEPA